MYQGLSTLLAQVVGHGIPYRLPGGDGAPPVQDLGAALGMLLLLFGLVCATVIGEETMFRYIGPILFSLSRHWGQSTVAPATMHALIYVVNLFG